MRTFAAFLICSGLQLLTFSARAGDSRALVHGIWIWKAPEVLKEARSAESLLNFCASENINEVYISTSSLSKASMESKFANLIGILHRKNIRVEALLGSVQADNPGRHREKLLERVREIVRFNKQHPAQLFDGIHLDVEPQQRAENKGPGNLKFLPGLVDAFRAVRTVAEEAGLTVNADIQRKLLMGNLSERKMLLTSVPRLTLMLYELSHLGTGESTAQMATKVRTKSAEFLKIAYEGLDEKNLAMIAVGLRVPDYGELLPKMLKTLDQFNEKNPHYLGWAWHSYNDILMKKKRHEEL